MSADKSSTQGPPSHDFIDVLNEELAGFGLTGTKDRASVLRRAHYSRLAGLAFSGGGIRSATFCLGVIQALADLRLLRRFHYLSTVSGGGYIGSWLIAWIHRRDRKLEGVASALRTAWNQQPGENAPEEIRFLRRFSNYLTPKLGWLGADTWTVVAIYLRNVLLNMTALVIALAGLLMLPRILGWGLSLLPTQGVFFLLLLAIFFGLLLLAGFFVHQNLQFFRVDQRAMWTADPLTLKDPKVEKATAPAPGDGFRSWFEDRTFGDFVLGFKFSLPSRASEADIVLRFDSADETAEEGESRSLQIHLGGEAGGKDPTRTSGGIVGQQEAKGAWLEGPGQPNEVQILCAGRLCTVRLNGRVVNVFRAGLALAAKGQIGSITTGEKRVTFSDLRLRELPGAPPGYIRQEWVQFSVILPLFGAALLTVRLLPLSFWPALAGWLPDFLVRWPWLLWGALAGAVALVVLLLGAPWAQPKEERPWQRLIVTVLAIIAGGLIGGAALEVMQTFLPPTTTEVNYWARLIWMPPAFIVAVSLMLVFYIGLCGRDLSEEMREWWSRLGAWLLIYTLLWLGLLGVAFYSPPLLHWLAENLRTALAALGFGWVATTISSLLAASSPTTGRRGKNRWLEMLIAIGPYVFIAGLVACLAWGIDLWLRPPGFSSERQQPRTVAVGVMSKAMS